MSKIIIVSLDYKQAVYHAHERQIKREDMIVVTDLENARGLKDLNYICVGQFYSMPDYVYVIEYLNSHGCIDITNQNISRPDVTSDDDDTFFYSFIGVMITLLFLLLLFKNF